MLGRLALTSFAHLRPFSDEELSDVKLALTEACTNSVRHAYHDAAGVVEILYELHPDRLIVEVSDNGEGFVPPSDRDSEGLAEGGLGLEIIRAVSDELEIEEASGGGSRLRFVKLLSG